MSKRELLTGIWLMSMALLSLFTFTVFFVAQMSPDILDIVCPILAAVQCITLVIYLWGPEKLKYKPLKILYRLMYATSILVIPVFIFSFSGLVSQYHVPISDSIDASAMPVQKILPTDQTTVYNTGTVYVIFPNIPVLSWYVRSGHLSRMRLSPGAAERHSSMRSVSVLPRKTSRGIMRSAARCTSARTIKRSMRHLFFMTERMHLNLITLLMQLPAPQMLEEAASCSLV